MLSINPKNSVSTSQSASFVVSYSHRHLNKSSAGSAGHSGYSIFQLRRKLKHVDIGSFKNISRYTNANSLNVSNLGNALNERPYTLVLISKGISFKLYVNKGEI